MRLKIIFIDFLKISSCWLAFSFLISNLALPITSFAADRGHLSIDALRRQHEEAESARMGSMGGRAGSARGDFGMGGMQMMGREGHMPSSISFHQNPQAFMQLAFGALNHQLGNRSVGALPSHFETLNLSLAERLNIGSERLRLEMTATSAAEDARREQLRTGPMPLPAQSHVATAAVDDTPSAVGEVFESVGSGLMRLFGALVTLPFAPVVALMEGSEPGERRGEGSALPPPEMHMRDDHPSTHRAMELAPLSDRLTHITMGEGVVPLRPQLLPTSVLPDTAVRVQDLAGVGQDLPRVPLPLPFGERDHFQRQHQAGSLADLLRNSPATPAPLPTSQLSRPLTQPVAMLPRADIDPRAMLEVGASLSTLPGAAAMERLRESVLYADDDLPEQEDLWAKLGYGSESLMRNVRGSVTPPLLGSVRAAEEEAYRIGGEWIGSQEWVQDMVAFARELPLLKPVAKLGLAGLEAVGTGIEASAGAVRFGLRQVGVPAQFADDFVGTVAILGTASTKGLSKTLRKGLAKAADKQAAKAAATVAVETATAEVLAKATPKIAEVSKTIAGLDLAGVEALTQKNLSTMMGEYRQVGGHHVHAKKAFEGHVNYNPRKGFSISEELMDTLSIKHRRVTTAQQSLFKELARSGRPNTLMEHTRIAVEALIQGGATRELARSIVARSLQSLRRQAVRVPHNIPWAPQ